MKTNSISYRQDGRLTVLQVSDPQDMVHVRKAMVQMLDRAYDLVRPDLVLFTGDNILGNHLLDARFGTRQVAAGEAATLEAIRKSLHPILWPLQKRGIPFAMIYGNHDDMNLISKEAQAEIFRSYSMCLPMNTSDPALDCDTYCIRLTDAQGKVRQALWMLDSAWYDKQADRCYTAVKPEAVAWYKRESEALQAENGGEPVPGLLFLHIPLSQTNNLLVPCPADAPDAVLTKEGPMRLDPAKAAGVLAEPPSVLDADGGLYDALLARRDVMAVVTGHDHCNSFIGRQDGLDFIQTPCASFRCYGNAERGVRVFELDAAQPAQYQTEMLHYPALCGSGLRARLRYLWDADEYEKKKLTLLSGGAALLLSGAAAAAAVKRKK